MNDDQIHALFQTLSQVLCDQSDADTPVVPSVSVISDQDVSSSEQQTVEECMSECSSYTLHSATATETYNVYCQTKNIVSIFDSY